MQRAPITATHQFAIQLSGPRAGALLCNRYEGVQSWVQLPDVIETPVSQFQAGDLSRAERLARFDYRHLSASGCKL
jgi:hypothetical protein